MEKVRVVHYLNQFFGQIGGEDRAGIIPQMKEGPVGVGREIQNESKGRFEIVRTIICGDNYAAEHLEEVEPLILKWVDEIRPDLFWAGPAFAAGRYGIACGTMCKAVQQKLGIPVITAIGKLCPGIALMLLSLLYLPMRGPSIHAPTNARTPPVMCTTDEPAKSAWPCPSPKF